MVKAALVVAESGVESGHKVTSESAQVQFFKILFSMYLAFCSHTNTALGH